jgi:hypothetical protein
LGLCEVTSDPNSKLKKIGDEAFSVCHSLVRLEISTDGQRPISFGSRCFAGCNRLREVNCPGFAYRMCDGLLY